MKRIAALTAGLVMLSLTASAAENASGTIILGKTLSEARAKYAAATTLARRDCDPAGSDQWVCASYNNPTLADYLAATGTSEPATASVSNPTSPSTSSAPSVSGGRVAVIGNTLQQSRALYARTTSAARADCDQATDGRWICASFNNPTLADLGTTSAPTAASGGSNDGSSSSSVNTSTPAPVNLTSGGSLEGDALYSPGDLIVLNYDSCPDADDLHAAVAARMVVDYYGFKLGQDYIVNNGACGDLRPRSDFVKQSPKVFSKLYGSEGSIATWQDAFGNEQRAARTTAAKMSEILVQGRKVWIMEGGPSDFTYEVLRLLQAANVGVSLKNVVVVQHSEGFNQQFTDQSHLAYVRNTADYRLIDNGNLRGNRTAQLNQNRSNSRTYSAPDGALVDRFRTNAVYGDAWRTAFTVLDPNQRFDGSDTVELLWILGLRSDSIADWYGFAQRFLPGVASASSPSVSVSAPTTVSNPTPATPVSSNLRAQVESASLRGGWERTSAGAIWLGPDRYALGNRNDDANLSYTLSVPTAGRYRFTMRSRSTPRGLTAARYAEEPPNDVWVRFGNRDWIKAFMQRDGQWHVQAIGELGSSKTASNLESNLPAGQVTVTISGRSRGHEVDYIELLKVN